jgi:hypothetical protein
MYDGVDSIHLVQNRDQWRALLKTVMEYGLQKMQGIFRIVEQLLASQERLCSMKCVFLI